MSRPFVRPALEEDIPRLCALYREMYTGHYRDGYHMPFVLNEEVLPAVLGTQITSRLCEILVLESQGAVCGFVSAYLSKPERKFTMEGMLGYIGDIYVAPEARRTGGAKTLLSRAEKWLGQNGATMVECNILARNAEGLGFWDAQNYKEMGKIYYKYL